MPNQVEEESIGAVISKQKAFSHVPTAIILITMKVSNWAALIAAQPCQSRMNGTGELNKLSYTIRLCFRKTHSTWNGRLG